MLCNIPNTQELGSDFIHPVYDITKNYYDMKKQPMKWIHLFE